MSRPRRPFGNDVPGRLPATMIKVITAEMTDSGRLARGKRMRADDAVIDIIVAPGVVTAEVQGSRSVPYDVTVRVEPGTGVPSRHEVRVSCTCPDDEGWGTTACKHAVAVLFTLSDEVAIEPEVLERWRGGSPHLRLVRDDEPGVTPVDDDEPVPPGRNWQATLRPATPAPVAVDPVAAVLDGGEHLMPLTFGPVEARPYRHHPDHQLDELIMSALLELTNDF